MAEACANCGRGDLLQPDLANYQCLACGALTSIATGQVVPNNIVNTNTSPSGHPLPELSNVVESPAGTVAGSLDPEHRLRPGDPLPHPAPDVDVAATPVSPWTPTFPASTEAPTVVLDTTSEAPGDVLVAPEPATVPSPAEPAPIDLSTLTPEQVAAVEAIAHPEA